jgi:transposase-like protein
MATNSRKRRTFTPQQRQQYVEQFRGCGLSQAEFCRRAGLCPVTFSLWRRTRKRTTAVFAEVQLAAPAPRGSDAPVLGGAAVLQLRDGARLEVAMGGESAWAGLGVMLKALQS